MGPTPVGILEMPVRRNGGQTGPVHTGATYAEYVAGPLTRLAASRGMALPLPDPGDPAEISDAPSVRSVFLHEDRWIVQCPGCARDYSLVWPVERLYMCPACWNAPAIHPRPGPLPSRERERSGGGLYLRVAMPDGWERVDREAGRAPDPRLRNWIPAGAGLKGALASEPEQTAEEIIKEFSRYE